MDKEYERLGFRATRYERPDSSIKVEWRGGDTWAVTDGRQCLNNKGKWEYEPLPSSRTEEFLARCRFTENMALAHAFNMATWGKISNG